MNLRPFLTSRKKANNKIKNKSHEVIVIILQSGKVENLKKLAPAYIHDFCRPNNLKENMYILV